MEKSWIVFSINDEPQQYLPRRLEVSTLFQTNGNQMAEGARVKETKGGSSGKQLIPWRGGLDEQIRYVHNNGQGGLASVTIPPGFPKLGHNEAKMVNCINGGVISSVTDPSYGGANIQRELMAPSQHDSNPRSASIEGAINNEGSFVGANNVEMVTAQNGALVLKGISNVTPSTHAAGSTSPKSNKGKISRGGASKKRQHPYYRGDNSPSKKAFFPGKDWKILLISQQRLRLRRNQVDHHEYFELELSGFGPPPGSSITNGVSEIEKS
ncbi:hypothetical protein LIER_07150 [Lithospermum erythrorhizon]|uniref:Uncharacterized protein n=1 Tax=Lithospermum erythrorhizon TaxID=34254 RepID=A0AAV3P787_LITER